MPSDSTVVAPGRSHTTQTSQANNTPSATDPDVEDQGATDEVITYGDEGENEGEMEMGTVVGMGGNGDIITQSSDLMADIKNSLVNETNANNNLESQTINGLNLKDLGLRHFDAARLAASGLTSLAAAVSGVNGATSAAMGMGGLSFNPYSHLPPPLLPYSHLTALGFNGGAGASSVGGGGSRGTGGFSNAGSQMLLAAAAQFEASKLYNPFASGITGLQLPPPTNLDPKAQTGISSGALSANNSTSDLSATGGSSQQAGNAQNQLGSVSNSNVPASSSPLQTVATSSAPYNTAAAALSNWAAVVSPQNGRLHVPPNGLSPNSLANLNQIHANSTQNGTAAAAAANTSSLAMFAAQMFNGAGRPASGPGTNAATVVTSNPYHHLLSLNAAAAAVVASGGNDPSRSGVPSSHNGFQRTLPNGGSVASPGGSSGIIPHPPNLLVNSHNGDSLLAGAHQQSGGAGGTHGNMGPHAEIMDHAQMKGKLSAMKPSKPYVKKPLNAFMLFMKENREKVMQESTLKESAAINQILGRKWHQLEKNEQNRYYDMAKNERLAHQRLHPNWSARDNYATSKHRRRRKRNMPGGMSDPSGDYPPDVIVGPNGPGRIVEGGPEMHNMPDHLGPGLMPSAPSAADHGALMPGAVMQNHSMLSGLLHHRGVVGTDHQQSDVRDTAGTHLNMSSTVSSSSDSHNISSDSVEAPESASKKCRARFGLDQQESWCKHCRRKKKCSVFIDNDDVTPSGHGSNAASKEKRDNNPKQRLNLPMVHEVRTNRISNDEGDESPGFNTDSMISIKNDLVNSLSENNAKLHRTSHFVIPPKKARSDIQQSSDIAESSGNAAKMQGESADTYGNDSHVNVVVDAVQDGLKREASSFEDTETESDGEGEENRSGREVQREESSESEDCLTATAMSDLKDSKQKDMIPASENSPIFSLVSNKLPLSLQGQILSNLNNNHISSSATALASSVGQLQATNRSMMQQTSQSLTSALSSDITSNSVRGASVVELSPSSKTDANVLSPLLDLHNNVLQNSNSAAVAASLGAITNQIKVESGNGSGTRTVDPTATNAKTSTAPASSISLQSSTSNSLNSSAISGVTPSSSSASAVPSSLMLSNGLPFTAAAAASNSIAPGHIPFAFSPFTPTVFTSVSNSTTPNSPFSPLQPTSAAAVAAAAAFGAGGIFASAPGANGTAPATAAGLPFTSFFGPTGFPGSPFSAAFKDPKEIMASMALASGSTTAAASQS